MTYEDVPIVQEPPPRVTPLTGDESAPDPRTLAVMFWLVRRYSSYAYIDRMYELLRRVNRVFYSWARGGATDSASSLRATTRVFDGAVADLESGLQRIAAGDRTAGYTSIVDALVFREALLDERNEKGLSLAMLRERLGPAVGLAAERACDMALRVRHTLTATWCCETILADRPSLRTRPSHLPDPLPPVPPPPTAKVTIETHADVPQTGIYLPAIRNACPNLLQAGQQAPSLTRAGERVDYFGLPADGEWPEEPPWTDYIYRSDEPTTWSLAWIDERYRDGLVVPEPEFLDDDNAIPEGLR